MWPGLIFSSLFWLLLYLLWRGHLLPVGAFYYYATISSIALLLFGFDKWAAMRSGQRVAERTLHLLSLLGGWPGAWYGQRLFRHKISKPAFQTWFWLMAGLHSGGLMALLWQFSLGW